MKPIRIPSAQGSYVLSFNPQTETIIVLLDFTGSPKPKLIGVLEIDRLPDLLKEANEALAVPHEQVPPEGTIEYDELLRMAIIASVENTMGHLDNILKLNQENV